MKKHSSNHLRLHLLLASVTALVIAAFLNIIPFNLSEGTGYTRMTYGVPFTYYRTEHPVVPNAVETTRFDLLNLIANIIVVVAVVFLVTYLYQVLRARARRG